MIKNVLITIILVQLVALVYGISYDPGFNTLIDIGPNVYTVGYNIIVPPSVLPTEKYYPILPTNNPQVIMQKAITDIGKVGGGTVYITEGVYNMTNNLETVNYLRLIGAGIDKTVLKLIDNAPAFSAGSIIHCKNDQHLIVADLTLDGNKYKQSTTSSKHGLWSEFCNYQWYNNVKTINFQKNGIFPHGNYLAINRYLTVTNCTSTGNTNDGLSTDYTEYVAINNVYLENNGRHGFSSLVNIQYINVTNSQALNNGYLNSGCGFMFLNNVQLFPNIIVSQNTVINNKKSGICIERMNNLNINYNNIVSDGTCFNFNSVTATILYNNTCNAKSLYSIKSTTITTDLPTYNNNVNTMVYIDLSNTIYMPESNYSGSSSSTGASGVSSSTGASGVSSSTGPGGSSSSPSIANDVKLYTSRIKIGPNFYTIGFDIATQVISPTVRNYQIKQTDSARALIQSVLADIVMNGGGTIYLKAGLYIIDYYIELMSNICIIGDGIDVTIIKLVDYAAIFNNAGMLRTRSGNNIILANFTIDGNKVNQNADPIGTDPNVISYGRFGLFTEGSHDLWFDRIKVTNMQGYGFDPHGWKSKMIYGNYLTITDCIASENDWDGFTLDQTLNMIVANCQAIHNGRHGYNIVTGSKHVTLLNNYAYNNGFYYPHKGTGCGFMFQNNQLFGTDDITVINNYAEKNLKAGYCINDIHNMNFSENVIVNSPYCYNIVDTTNTVITGTQCSATRVYTLSGTVATTSLSTYNSVTMIYYAPDNKFTAKTFVP
jgi:hypothetical protein